MMVSYEHGLHIDIPEQEEDERGEHVRRQHPTADEWMMGFYLYAEGLPNTYCHTERERKGWRGARTGEHVCCVIDTRGVAYAESLGW